MRIFVSSAIAGMEEYRAAAAEAIRALGYEVVRSEDFPASDATPQQACLAGVRSSELTVVLLGGRYGHVQSTGRSATHDEYLEAKHHSRPIVFIQEGVERDERQDAFIREVRDWAGGVYTASFSSPDELRRLVTQHLHQLLLTGGISEADALALHDRAVSLASSSESRHTGESARIVLGIVSGPRARVIFPSDLNEGLAARLHMEAAFGEFAVFDRSSATETLFVEGGLILRQERAELFVDEYGSVRIKMPTGGRSSTWTPLPGIDVLIEEAVRDTIHQSILYAGTVLEMVDKPRRVPDSAVVAGVLRGQYLAWRTAEEHRLNPGSVQLNHRVSEAELVPPSPYVVHRGDLTGSDASRVAADLTAMLRARFQGGALRR